MDKVKFLIDQNLQEIIAYIVEDDKIEYDDALDIFFRSQTFEKLYDSDTGLYRESAAYIYELFKTELKTGKVISTEQ